MSDAPEFLTVPELADLLRIKERKVYDLAASGDVPCTRATGKLLFPRAEVRVWIEKSSAGGHVPRPRVVLGSHDPLLDWAIRASGCGLASLVDGSLDGLRRFGLGEGAAAGLHVFSPDSDDWNIPQVAEACAGRDVVLIAFARRARGLVMRRGLGLGGLADLAGHRFVPRQAGSGSDVLWHHLAAQAGLDLAALTLTEVARTETEAVQAVARGEAEATLGLASVARDFGLQLLPLVQERFDLLVDRRAFFEPPLQELMRFCRTDAFAAQAARMGGYDISDLGAVRWNG